MSETGQVETRPDDIRIVVAIPTAGMVHWRFTKSYARMVSWFATNPMPELGTSGVSLTLDCCESSNWITNRERLAKRAIESGKTHLMFLDDDMTFEPEVLPLMLKRHQHIVVTNYLMKSDPASSAKFVACNLNGEECVTSEKSTGIEPVAFSGFGVSLIHTDVFKALPQPWFAPSFVPERDEYTTEDVPFYHAARQAGFPVFLDHDASKLIKHIGRKIWSWDERK